MAQHKRAVINLSEQARKAKAVSTRVAELEGSLAEKDATIRSLQERLEGAHKSQKEESFRLVEKYQKQLSSERTKNDKLQKEFEALQKAERATKAQLKESITSTEADKTALLEQFESAKKDYAIKLKALNEQLTARTKEAERYKRAAKQVMESYIAQQALAMGLPKEDIVNKLGKSYTFEDVDRVCNSLREQYYNLSRLPFEVGRRKVGVVVTESKTPEPMLDEAGVMDDCVDDSLLRLAKLK